MQNCTLICTVLHFEDGMNCTEKDQERKKYDLPIILVLIALSEIM
jgi:hypothetical protein